MPAQYARSQILLHWLTVLLLVVAYAMMELRGFTVKGSWPRDAMTVSHFSVGCCVLLFMVVRLLERLRKQTPPITPAVPRWQTGMSHLVHTLLYVLFVVLPVLGIMSRYLKGSPWSMFWLNMPVAAAPDPATASMLIHWHETLANLGYWLMGLHAAAALFHHIFLRDDTLRRMLP